jgi:hypothetical protein
MVWKSTFRLADPSSLPSKKGNGTSRSTRSTSSWREAAHTARLGHEDALMRLAERVEEQAPTEHAKWKSEHNRQAEQRGEQGKSDQ